MKMTYDPRADALAIDLLDAKTARSAQLAPNVTVDFDADGRLTSIEILGASVWYPPGELEHLHTGVEWLTLAEAAAAAATEGEPISPDTLRSQVHKGRLPAEKRGRDLMVTRHDLLTYLESRAPQGRRAAGRQPDPESPDLGRLVKVHTNVPADLPDKELLGGGTEVQEPRLRRSAQAPSERDAGKKGGKDPQSKGRGKRPGRHAHR